jgi:predicted DNA binding CopG/RHH family protein
MSKPKLKRFPIFQTDEEAEHFVDTADLSEYDFSGFVPLDLNKLLGLSIDVPHDLVEALKARASEQGVAYERYVRDVLEKAAQR